MPAEKFDIEAFQEALGELIKADSPEETASVVTKNSVLLHDEAEAEIDKLINNPTCHL